MQEVALAHFIFFSFSVSKLVEIEITKLPDPLVQIGFKFVIFAYFAKNHLILNLG